MKADECNTARDKTCGLLESRLVLASFIKQVHFNRCTSFLPCCIIDVAAEIVASETRRACFFFSILFYPPLTNNGMNVSNCTRFISRCTLIVARLRAQALVSAPQCAVGSLKIKCVVFGAFQEETVASSG